MDKVIEVQGLKKSYPLPRADRKAGKTEFEAVKGTSFTVNKGEIFGILGPNGAGKTTTLEILEGLKKQTSGTVTVLGLNNIEQSQDIKRRIGVQLQSSEYFNRLSLSELILLFGSLYGTKPDPLKLLGFVGLQDKAHEQVTNLSGGQKQRFTLASSLVNDPEILFLDEPTTGLDPRARREVWQLIRSINERGITVVITTHYMEEAEYLCDRVAIMAEGKILTMNEPQALIEDLSHTTQISFFIDEELPADWAKSIPDIDKVFSHYPKVILEVKSLDSISQIINSLKQTNVRFSGFTVKTATLEDVYLDLTGQEFGEESEEETP